MNVARTTYRSALVAAALSCLGYASLAHADRDHGRDGWRGDRRWTEVHAPERYDRHRGDRYDRHRGERHSYGRPGWGPPRQGWHEAPRWSPPRYWRPAPRYYYYYAPPPRYYRPYPGSYGYPRYYGGWRGTAYPYGDACDDDVSLTIRIPF